MIIRYTSININISTIDFSVKLIFAGIWLFGPIFKMSTRYEIYKLILYINTNCPIDDHFDNFKG